MAEDNIYKNGAYLQNNPTWDISDSPFKGKEVVDILCRNHIKPETICDVGCGAGGVLQYLQEQIPDEINFTGYDVSPQAIEMAKKNENSRLKFLNKDIFENPSTSYDVALLLDVFEHVDDYLGFLSKFREVAEYKVFHIPLDIHLSSVFRVTPIMFARERVGHLHYFNKETALATLKYAGYELIDWSYTKGALELKRGKNTERLQIPRKFLYWLSPDWAARTLGGFSLIVLAK